MSNIEVKKENGNVPRPGAVAPKSAPMVEWEPSRWFARMLGFDPFREMMPFPPEERGYGFAPAFEVKETKEAYVFKADTPGLKEKDLEVTVQGKRLTIAGHREEEKKEQSETYYTYERSYGSFSRAFTLPEGADLAKVVADLKDGVLTIQVPKKVESQAKKIEIGSPEKKS